MSSNTCALPFARVVETELAISIGFEPLDFSYGPGVCGPQPEYRSLDAIRSSLQNPGCSGPDPVYAIAMDVAREGDSELLRRADLLFGVVAYTCGRLGAEPVRSQGHVHAASRGGLSTPELIEVWIGDACVYLQERVSEDAGRCFAVDAGPGDQIVIPPGWAHFIINASPNSGLAFGAWCTREYAFEYEQVRANGGLAWFPVFASDGSIEWQPNQAYLPSRLRHVEPRAYPELGLSASLPIYGQAVAHPNRFRWISHPETCLAIWQEFEF